MIRKALVLSLLAFAAVVAPAFANAPNPIPGMTRAVATVDPNTGNTTVTVMGTWQWGANVPSGGQKDCNDTRSGIGYAIAWNDPSDPGNVIPASGAQPAVAVGDSHDNWVHSVSQPGGPFVSSTSPNVSGNGNEVPGDGTDATHLTVFGPLTTTSPFYTPVTESMAGTTGDGPFAGQGIPTTALGSNGPLSGDQNSWFSNCGPVSAASVVFNGHTITTTGNDSPASPKNGYPAGFWGPISHTYKSQSGPFTLCPVMYDPHGGPVGSHAGSLKDVVAGGTGRNDDNSIEKNGNAPASCPFNVIVPALSTQASVSAAVGNTFMQPDTATINGSNPQGTITWHVYGPFTSGVTPVCDAAHETATGTSFTATVNGNGPYTPSASFTPTAAGNYQWTATFAPNANDTTNQAIGPVGCNDSKETLTVTKATPKVLTTQDPSTGTVGITSFNDKATISGLQGANPSGTISWTLYSNNNCTGQVANLGPVTVTGNGTYETNSGTTVNKTGTYYWVASYSDDANNNPSSSGCADEPITVNPANPTVITTQDPASGTVGVTSFNDQATISGLQGASPGGTISWTLYSNSNCTGQAATLGPVTVTGNGTYEPNAGTIVNQTGTYYWVASYSGDTNNNAKASGCSDEPVTVNRVAPGIITTQDPSTGIVGGTFNDKAVISGLKGINPGGTITWTLYSSGNCTGTAATLGPVTVTGNGTYEPGAGTIVNQTGTYFWVASYSGDANNTPESSGCADEPVGVNPATPAVTTTQDPSSGTVGVTSFNDKATISGLKGINPGGSITWTLYSNSNCTSQVRTLGPVTVNGNGTYEPNAGTTVNNVGTYYWVASYSGDANNNPKSSGCADEPVTVNPSTPTVTTTQDPSSGTAGGSFNDKAVITGLQGINPGGTITWTLYSNSNCTGQVTTLGPVTVNGNGTYEPNSGTTINNVATYYWVASYSGDANNNPKSSGCSDEPVNVGGTPDFTIAKKQAIDGSGQPFTTATLTGLQGQTIDYQITVTNTGNLPLTFSSFSDAICDAGTISGGPGASAVQPGASTVWTCTHLITAADQANGSVTNVASVTGTPTTGGGGQNKTSNQVVVNIPSPGITILKQQQIGDTGGFTSNTLTANVGDTVNYKMIVSNTGATSLGLTLNDPHCDPGTVSGPFAITGNLSGSTLAAGGQAYFLCSHVLLASDRPSFTNTATATGTPPSGPPVTSPPSSVVVTINPPGNPPNPGLNVVKSQTVSGSNQPYTTATVTANPGQTVLYHMTVTNTGNEPLALNFSDPHCDAGTLSGPAGGIDGNGDLAVGAQTVYSCSHLIAAADAPAFTNVVTVTGTPPGGTPTPPVSSSVVANVPQQAVAPSCVAGNVALQGTVGCARRAFQAVVQAAPNSVKSVTFVLDGKTIKTLTHVGAGNRWAIMINPGKLRFGGHTLIARVTLICNGTRRVATLHFRHCKPPKPRFTG